MKKRIFALLVVVSTLAMMLMGCGSSAKYDMAAPEEAVEYTTSTSDTVMGGMGYSNNKAEVMEAEDGFYEPYEPGNAVGENGAGATDVTITERKLIRTVNVDMETKEFDLMMSEVEAHVKAMGGYIENMDTYNGSAYHGRQNNRYAYLTIRVPADKLDSFLQEVSEIGNVISRNEDVEDVTLSYVDMESRRDMLRIEQERLLAILEKSDKIEDIIAIEERLSNVRYQLQSMESQIRTIDNQVDYSTVRLNISEVKDLTPVAEQTAFERIGEGFVKSLEDIAEDAVDLFVWVVVRIPFFVIWAGIIALLVVLFKARKKRRAAKKAAKEVAKNEM